MTMTLPASEPTAVRRFDTLVPGDVEGWILLVEDCEDDAFLTRRALAKAGISCPVLTVDDGVEALDLIWAKSRSGESMPTLILLDTQLPRRDGFGVLEQLRRGATTRGVAVMILTSCGLGEARFVADDFGRVAFMRKPVTPERFTESARSLEVDELLPASQRTVS